MTNIGQLYVILHVLTMSILLPESELNFDGTQVVAAHPIQNT